MERENCILISNSKNWIDGKWYFFNEVSDGTKGALMTDTWIEGYYVGKDGAWVPDAQKE